MLNMNEQRQEVDTGIAYILWACGCFGLFGIHRLYLGKIGSGLLYLCTLGLFGFGQFIDLFLIPGMVQQKNLSLWHKAATNGRFYREIPTSIEPAQSEPMVKLLKAAAIHNNTLSLGQAIIATELPVEQVEKLLAQALKQGIAHIDNDVVTGAVRYYFDV